MIRTDTEQCWMDAVRAVGGIMCRRFGQSIGANKIELHHVAEGSGMRSQFAIAPLCSEHHRGSAGLHGLGVKRFIALYRPHGDTEYGLLVWTNEDLAGQWRKYDH